MKEQIISTSIGDISVAYDEEITTIPIVFMHGVFLDRTLWDNYSNFSAEHSNIYVDMPAHGKSSNVGRSWKLEECVEMLISILNALNVEKCIAIGQSWGSMTALRAADQYPERFAALGLFNMPISRTEGLSRIGFQLQKLMTIFPRFYATQAAKSLYTKKMLDKRPELSSEMQARLASRPAREIANIINAVILGAKDSDDLVDRLTVPAMAVKGKLDYVDTPRRIETVISSGGHVTPHEDEAKTIAAINQVIEMAGIGT